jgi:hypothetical protein
MVKVTVLHSTFAIVFILANGWIPPFGKLSFLDRSESGHPIWQDELLLKSQIVNHKSEIVSSWVSHLPSLDTKRWAGGEFNSSCISQFPL